MKFSFAQKSLACMLASSITITAFAIAHSSRVANASPQPPADVIVDEVEMLDEVAIVESDDDDDDVAEAIEAAIADDGDDEMMEEDAAQADDSDEGENERDDNEGNDEEPNDNSDFDAEQQEVDHDELQIQELVNDIRESSPDAKVSKREELRNKLKETLLKRTARQQQRIEQMKRRLELVEQQLQRRVELSEQIVDRRLGELLDEQDELSWDHEPNVDPHDIDGAEAPVGEVTPATRKPGVEELPVIVQEKARAREDALRAKSMALKSELSRASALDLVGSAAKEKMRAIQAREQARVFAAKEEGFKAQANELQSKLVELDKAKVASDVALEAADSRLKRGVDRIGLKDLETKRLQMEQLIELQTKVDELQSKLDATRSERDTQRSPKKR